MTARPPDDRGAGLADNLARVRARIATACAAAGRDPDEVTLVAVTKTFPAADVVRLAELGVRDIGENRDQEATAKVAEVARAKIQVRWHFVGRLQRNKCRSVVRYADLVQSVDSVRLAAALGVAAATRDRPLDVLVQVSIDADADRSGAVVAAAGGSRSGGLSTAGPGAGPAAGPRADRELARVVEAIAGQGTLRLRGVMAVAPMSWSPAAAFARLAEVATALRADHPDATIISAGMSGDLEAALAHGATHLRIGAALLGNRPPLR